MRAGHRNDAPDVGTIVEFRLDLIARAAFTPMVFFARIFRERIAALNHEALDHTMKAGAVVKSFFRERFEIFDRSGRDLGPEFNDHFAFSRPDHGHFFGVAWGRLVPLLLLVLLFRFFFVGLAEGAGEAERKNHRADQPEFFHALCVPRSCGVVTSRFLERQLDDARRTFSRAGAPRQFGADLVVLAADVAEGDVAL